MTTEPVLTITFEPPGKLINLNDREHWSKRSQLVKLWRTAAFYATKQAMHDTGVKRLEGRHRIAVEFPVRGQRRRDNHNFPPKACVDGIVDSGLILDDSTEYVTVDEPTLTVGGTHVVIRITAAPLAQ